jgi:hypothetical protein
MDAENRENRAPRMVLVRAYYMIAMMRNMNEITRDERDRSMAGLEVIMNHRELCAAMDMMNEAYKWVKKSGRDNDYQQAEAYRDYFTQQAI